MLLYVLILKSEIKKLNSLKSFTVFVIAFFLTACQTDSVKTDIPNMPSNAYLDGKNSTVGVVLCHGRGKYPTWLVVDPLRKGINQQLGYHTLSIQMPTVDGKWWEYESLFPDAYRRIDAAVRYLKEEKNVQKVYLMGHSMGSRMATAYLNQNPDSGIAGFIGVGIRNEGGGRLDSNLNLRMVTLPVLDLYGDGGDGKDAEHARIRSDMVDDRYQQVLIPGANHKFTQHEKQMVDSVVSWLRKQEGKKKIYNLSLL